MGIFDFVKKIFSDEAEKGEKPESVKIEKIKAEDLELWISRKKAESEKRSGEIVSLIWDKIKQTVGELEAEKGFLDKIDLRGKKENEKIKLVVKDNLNNYSEYLGMLINGLKGAETKDLNKLITRINFLFYDFDKKSFMAYQKANILVGKELQAVRITSRNFTNDIRGILNSNKSLAENSKVVHFLDGKIRELVENSKINAETKSKIEDLRERIGIDESEIVKSKEKAEAVRKSESYKAREKEEEKLDYSKEKLKEEIAELGKMIDFKKLAGIIHTNEKKMNVLKEYRANFEKAFIEEGGDKIISLLKDSGLDDVDLANKLDEIIKIRDKIDKEEAELNKKGKNEIANLEKEIKKAEDNISKIRIEIANEEKKTDKVGEKRKEILDFIRAELLKVSVELEA